MVKLLDSKGKQTGKTISEVVMLQKKDRYFSISQNQVDLTRIIHENKGNKA
jgi:hypothetical protein